MREYYTETFYASVLKSNINDKTNAQRIHPPQNTVDTTLQKAIHIVHSFGCKRSQYSIERF